LVILVLQAERNQNKGGMVMCATVLVIMCFIMLTLLILKESLLWSNYVVIWHLEPVVHSSRIQWKTNWLIGFNPLGLWRLNGSRSHFTMPVAEHPSPSSFDWWARPASVLYCKCLQTTALISTWRCFFVYMWAGIEAKGIWWLN